MYRVSRPLKLAAVTSKNLVRLGQKPRMYPRLRDATRERHPWRTSEPGWWRDVAIHAGAKLDRRRAEDAGHPNVSLRQLLSSADGAGIHGWPGRRGRPDRCEGSVVAPAKDLCGEKYGE